MRSKKNGNAPVPKIAWEKAGLAHWDAYTAQRDLIERFKLDSSTELGKAVMEGMQDQYFAAVDCIVKAGETRAGRPRAPVGIIASANKQSEKPKKIGRPQTHPAGWNTEVYRRVEIERARLKAHNINKGSVTDAIDSLLKVRIAPLKKWTQRKTVDKYRAMTRAAYYAGKKLEHC